MSQGMKSILLVKLENVIKVCKIIKTNPKKNKVKETNKITSMKNIYEILFAWSFIR